MKSKNKFQVEYRYNGCWLPLSVAHQTKKIAEAAAKNSACCQREGYQVRKLK